MKILHNKKFVSFFEGPWSFAILLLVGTFFWWQNLGHVFTIVCAIYIFINFFVSSSPANALFAPLTIAFFLNSFKDSRLYGFYAVSLSIFVIGATYYLIKMLCVKKQKAKLGKMFFAFVFFACALFFGGLIGNFNIFASFVLVLLCLAAYFYYFVAINFIKDLKQKLCWFFVMVGVQIFAEILIVHIHGGNFWVSLSSKHYIEIGVQNINVVAVYAIFSMLSMFVLALEHQKHDHLFCLGAVAFYVVVFLTYSRICALVGLILLVAGLIVVFAKSSNKKIFGAITAIFVAVFAVLCAVMFEKICELVERYLEIGVSLNGREELWQWCWQKFVSHPIFGIGFVSSEPVPSVTTPSIVMAHNSVLQFLTSTGIVGSIFVGVFYLQKYHIVFGKNGLDLFACASTIMIAIIGLVDQCPTTDVFVFIITILVVAVSENKSCLVKKPKQKPKQKSKVCNFNS